MFTDNWTVQKYGVIYAGDARLKTIARNEAEEAAIAEIARKRDEAYNKKVMNKIGITHRQAARSATKWLAAWAKKRVIFHKMLLKEFMLAQ